MGHYAKVKNGIVENIIVATQEVAEAMPDSDDETSYIKCSYNTMNGVHYGSDGNPDGGAALRYNFPSIGHTYDSVRDAFYPAKPFPSWVLDEATCSWNTPTPHPDDGKYYLWDESTTSWVEE
tara:strand:- start:1541 stop:1906 length:366 start_codon:yes stop_codon:yes gene_type:complete